MKKPRIKPITDDFTARIFIVDGHQVVFEKTEKGYEFVGILEPIEILSIIPADKVKGGDTEK